MLLEDDGGQVPPGIGLEDDLEERGASEPLLELPRAEDRHAAPDGRGGAPDRVEFARGHLVVEVVAGELTLLRGSVGILEPEGDEGVAPSAAWGQRVAPVLDWIRSVEAQAQLG
jgi:hypothetical protein